MARVLIVEDSASQAAVITELLKEAGHEPLICPDLSRGVTQVLKPLSPDIVLLDLVLLGPDGQQVADGFHVCREIKRVSNNKIGVVIVSAKEDDESAEWALLQGADAFLQKPFAVKDLMQVIQLVLEHKRGQPAAT